VVEGGLRPVIAMMHYPVVSGRKGHAVVTPLSVMVHRNTPFRIAVDVRGNRLTASVEGLKVESWTDDLVAKGGVGFFSEAGDRARLYWMKVSRNQDMVGSICSFLAGGGSETAEIRRPEAPANRPQPAPPANAADAALADAEAGPGTLGGLERARNRNQGRIRSWSC
jgi:hypothetical protein